MSTISAGGRSQNQESDPRWVNALALVVWLIAGAVAFLPFAFDTSPLDAVMLRVPGNQGNWWHLLAGMPYFLAFPMIWLRFRSLTSRPSTPLGRRILWIVAALSALGTLMVESPFLLHLAGTSDWQRFAVLSLGFGILVLSAIALLVRRRSIAPTRACILALEAAYLANDALCLVVYSEATGSFASRSGWFVSIVIVWFILLDLIRHIVQAFKPQRSPMALTNSI